MDSRFFIQAAAQLEGSGIEMMKLKVEGTPSVADWLKARLEADDIVAMDENLFPYSEYMEMMDLLAPLSPALIEDPFDKVWKDRPALQLESPYLQSTAVWWRNSGAPYLSPMW